MFHWNNGGFTPKVYLPAVISDEVLPLDDEESLYVRSILHHGLPLRKADFRHRLALLYPAIVK